MSRGGKKIVCPQCRQDSVIKIIKKYDGFTLVGEVETCGFCGYEFAAEKPSVIEEKTPDWIKTKGERRVCYRCEHYVINPFIQKCVLFEKEVEALDSCSRFSPKPVPPPKPPEPEKQKSPPSLL